MAITLNGDSGILGAINSGTAQNTTSGTSIDFTSIPAGVKRITVMFNGVSTNSTSPILLQLGSGSPQTTGYTSGCFMWTGGSQGTSYTAGIGLRANGGQTAADTLYGNVTLTLVSGNTWVASGVLTAAWATNGGITMLASSVNLAGVLDRVRLTTLNGTDTFDAGSINILYE